MDSIGDKICLLRKSFGLSQEDLAEKVGVSRQTIYKWEANIVQPNYENLEMLCAALNVDKDYFYMTNQLNDKTHHALPVKEKGLHIKLIISVTLFAVLSVVSCFVTVILGLMTITTNKGDGYVLSIDFDYGAFILALICSIIFISIDIIFIILLKKYRRN